ncbi:MAG: ribosome recycling factor [Bacilli bacterium]|mgnify:CR=1 FL=1|nr:ribosome recycling factor [Bacilli bacterium]
MDEYVTQAQQEMNARVDALKNSLVSLRTGRANPAMLNNIMVDYYGSPTPINQISSVSVPEPRQLLIKPYDKNDCKAVVSAINASDIGINPINEGTQIRLMIPALTEERRKEIVKQARKYGEETKVAIRNIRRDYMDLIKGDDGMSEDYQKKVVEDLEKVTGEAVKLVDTVVGDKEKELMTL